MPDDTTGLRHLILATAGHVDHGKTALVKALTGIDTDRLPEEKARGITIDLGFAHLAVPGFSIGVVDVPGHEDFIRNMIAGLGAIDLALLVVAADDGWMPQTEEHLQILNYLGVRHGVVTISKCDLGNSAQVEADVRKRLRGTSLGEMPIVQTSVRTASGLKELKDAVVRVASSIPEAREIGKPRLFVDRVFSLRGTGTVVTGTLSGGQFERGAAVSLQPQNLRAHVRAIQSHNRPLEVALPATRTALNLPELRPDEIPRGSVVTATPALQTSRAIDVLIERSGRDPLPARPLRNASILQVHSGGSRFPARIVLFDRRELLPGDRGLARLRFTSPVFVFVGDRLILRDSSGRRTIAGGVVLDSDAEGTKFRSSTERRFLLERAAAPDDLATLLRTQLRRDRAGRPAELLAKANFSREEIATALSRLTDEGEVFARGGMVIDGPWWQQLRERAMETINAEHEAHPEHLGLDLGQFRMAVAPNNPELSDALIGDLVADGFSSSKGVIRRDSHRPSLPAALAPAGTAIRAALAAQPFDPPSRKGLISNAAAQQALRFLSETGEVVLLNAEVVLSEEAFARMKMLVEETLRERGSATASELRQVLGTSRRILIPFLERCDLVGLTTREGDRRRLR